MKQTVPVPPIFYPPQFYFQKSLISYHSRLKTYIFMHVKNLNKIAISANIWGGGGVMALADASVNSAILFTEGL